MLYNTDSAVRNDGKPHAGFKVSSWLRFIKFTPTSSTTMREFLSQLNLPQFMSVFGRSVGRHLSTCATTRMLSNKSRMWLRMAFPSLLQTTAEFGRWCSTVDRIINTRWNNNIGISLRSVRVRQAKWHRDVSEHHNKYWARNPDAGGGNFSTAFGLNGSIQHTATQFLPKFGMISVQTLQPGKQTVMRRDNLLPKCYTHVYLHPHRPPITPFNACLTQSPRRSDFAAAETLWLMPNTTQPQVFKRWCRACTHLDTKQRSPLPSRLFGGMHYIHRWPHITPRRFRYCFTMVGDAPELLPPIQSWIAACSHVYNIDGVAYIPPLATEASFASLDENTVAWLNKQPLENVWCRIFITDARHITTQTDYWTHNIVCFAMLAELLALSHRG